jgi:nitrate/nitrite transport system ATP-binding protein
MMKNRHHAFVSAESLAKRFPAATKGEADTVIFENLNFQIQEGEFICCLGHSGCGKSTILNILAGLDTASSGGVIMDGREIAGPGLSRAVVFQNHSLLPWLSAFQNVALAVRSKWPKWTPEQVNAHCRRYLEMVGLGKVADRKPHQLSGGMKQRVGIARAFAIDSALLLLDEPFGALDALTRGTIQDELVRIWNETRKTVFMITHDIDEAILLSDRIFLMTNGPRARIAESVRIDIPRPRTRSNIIHDPNYYAIRNHLVEFLVSRSHELSTSVTVPAQSCPASDESGKGLPQPPEVNPAHNPVKTRAAC